MIQTRYGKYHTLHRISKKLFDRVERVKIDHDVHFFAHLALLKAVSGMETSDKELLEINKVLKARFNNLKKCFDLNLQIMRGKERMVSYYWVFVDQDDLDCSDLLKNIESIVHNMS